MTAEADRRRGRRVPAAGDRRASSAGCSCRAGGLRTEKQRLYVIAVLFLAAALFWSVFEQAGSTLNLFADRSTDTRCSATPFPSTLVPVAQLVVPDHPRAGVRVGVGRRWRRAGPGAVEPGEVRAGPGVRGPRVRRADRAGARCRAGHARQPDVADAHLPAAHHRRAGAQPRGTERHDRAGPGAHRRAGDGCLVPRDLGRQLHRRPGRLVLRVVRAADPVRRHRDVRHCRRRDPRRPGPARCDRLGRSATPAARS